MSTLNLKLLRLNPSKRGERPMSERGQYSKVCNSVLRIVHVANMTLIMIRANVTYPLFLLLGWGVLSPWLSLSLIVAPRPPLRASSFDPLGCAKDLADLCPCGITVVSCGMVPATASALNSPHSPDRCNTASCAPSCTQL